MQNKRTDSMPKKEKAEKEEKISIPKSTVELLPFVCIDKGLFYMSDKSYADIMQPASRRCRNTFSEVLAIWKISFQIPNRERRICAQPTPSVSSNIFSIRSIRRKTRFIGKYCRQNMTSLLMSTFTTRTENTI